MTIKTKPIKTMLGRLEKKYTRMKENNVGEIRKKYTRMKENNVGETRKKIHQNERKQCWGDQKKNTLE